MKPDKTDSNGVDRMAWFESARFGMFIHWGLYSLIGRGEWVLNRERIPLAEYVKLADRFTVEHYDPRAWARLAAEAGMKYMVLTTKHHEGFCLWGSKACSFNSVNSAARRDLVGEYVEAARECGLKVGLYYSLGDWYNADWTAGWSGDDAARQRFMDYTHQLVRELLTGYGKIDILWYDLPQCYTSRQWRSVDLNAMARRLQPEILINNRALTTEDFFTPEQHIASSPDGRMAESNMTLNNNWGYCPSDTDYKSPRQVVLALAAVATGSGNLLLNVGPDGQGRIPDESIKILKRVGQWLKVHGESIYGSNRHDLSFNLWGPVTVKGHSMYLHLQRYFGETLTVGGLTNKVLGATLLTTGDRLKVHKTGDQTIISGLPPASPDELVSVVKLELDGPPDQDIGRVIGGADVPPAFP